MLNGSIRGMLIVWSASVRLFTLFRATNSIKEIISWERSDVVIPGLQG